MERVSCIKHREKSSFLKVHEDYLDLLGRDFCAAVVLAVFEYWTNSKTAQMIKESRTGEPWVEAAIPELYTEMLGMYSQKSIQEAVKVLEASPFLAVQRPGRGQLNRYLVNSKALNKALNPDGKITDENQSSTEPATEVSTENLPSLNNRDSETEEELTPSVGSLSEKLPERPPATSAVVDGLLSAGVKLTGAQRKQVHAKDFTGKTLGEAVVECRTEFGNGHQRKSAGIREPRPAQQPRYRAAIIEDIRWKGNAWLLAFRERYSTINPSTGDAHWRDAHDYSMALTDEERAKAWDHILTCDGAWVQDPGNYLRDKKFMLPPRPKPKSELERMMGL